MAITRAHFVVAFSAFFYPILGWTATECALLNRGIKSTLFSYLRHKYNLPTDVNFEIVADEFFEATCYRQLTIDPFPARIGPIMLWLSPDQRFLAFSMIDPTLSPGEMGKSDRDRLNAILMAQKSPARGSEKAAATIVEFSDFQCSFCKRFAD